MINKKIQSKVQAAQVSSELVQDLHKEIDTYGSYQVRVDDTTDTIRVAVVSERTCNIITCCVVGTIMGVAEMYYKAHPVDVTYHLGVEKWIHDNVIEFIPAFVFTVMFHEEETGEEKE
jgi:hypothetical protein